MDLPLVISTSPGKRFKHLRGRKTAIQGKDSAVFNAVNSPLPLVFKLSFSLRCSICHFPHLPASHHHLCSSISPRGCSLPCSLTPQSSHIFPCPCKVSLLRLLLHLCTRQTQESLRTAGVVSPVLPYWQWLLLVSSLSSEVVGMKKKTTIWSPAKLKARSE